MGRMAALSMLLRTILRSALVYFRLPALNGMLWKGLSNTSDRNLCGEQACVRMVVLRPAALVGGL
jgi:hypothetical protein